MTRWFAVLALAIGSCGKAPSEDQCHQLLDHIVDLEFKKAGVAATNDQMKADIAKQKTAVVEAREKDFIEVCTKKTSKQRVECATAATTLECGENQKECNSIADCDK